MLESTCSVTGLQPLFGTSFTISRKNFMHPLIFNLNKQITEAIWISELNTIEITTTSFLFHAILITEGVAKSNS